MLMMMNSPIIDNRQVIRLPFNNDSLTKLTLSCGGEGGEGGRRFGVKDAAIVFSYACPIFAFSRNELAKQPYIQGRLKHYCALCK